jgi:hypothetical protein
MKSGPKPGAETTRVHYVYDAWNRLVGVYEDASGNPGSLIAAYTYDALNRRIKKTLDTGTNSGDDYYYNQNWQVVEDENGSDAGTDYVEQYIWSPR